MVEILREIQPIDCNMEEILSVVSTVDGEESVFLLNEFLESILNKPNCYQIYLALSTQAEEDYLF